METRSKAKQEAKKQLYQVNIDFDEASKCWRKNKKLIGNGCYKYICLHKTEIEKPCKRNPEKNSDFCKMHLT